VSPRECFGRLPGAGARVRLSGTVRLALLALLAGAAGVACRQDMHDQPKYRPLRASEFFADGRSARPLVAGTVARGSLREDVVYFTGKAGTQYVAQIPVEVTPALLARGQERYQIFCSPCHGRTGRGDGMIVQRGFKAPSSYHVDRLRAMPIGYYYDVITNGFATMPDYAGQLPPADRWAIAAYVRVLQFSQYAPAAEIPAEHRSQLDASVAAQAAEVHPR
jgi:mono/diheme cytochrome c family protein